MRVLVATGLYPPEIGGPATYTVELEKGLPGHGIEVAVVPYSKVRKYWKVVRHIAYFFILISKGRSAQIIYAQDPVSVGLPAALAAFVLGKKFLLKVVGDYAWEQATQRAGFTGTLEEFQTAKLSLFPKILRFIERWVARRAVRVVVPSKYLRGIVSRWQVAEGRMTVVYNGVAIPEIGLKQVIRGLLRFQGRLVVSVGRLVPWKGFDALIRVHARMCATLPDLRLMIVGNGPDRQKLEALAISLGVHESVVFTGALERDILLRYIRAADVFVLNTSYEGFSHLLLEVSLVGAPIVTTPIGGNPELIEGGVNGLLVKPNDEHALEEKITALLTDTALRAKLSTNAKRKAEKFSVSRMVSETASVIRGILQT
jgi:glycosyltransferase involved in cell wall biosynthesis